MMITDAALWVLLVFLFVGALVFCLGILLGAWLRRPPNAR